MDTCEKVGTGYTLALSVFVYTVALTLFYGLWMSDAWITTHQRNLEEQYQAWFVYPQANQYLPTLPWDEIATHMRTQNKNNHNQKKLIKLTIIPVILISAALAAGIATRRCPVVIVSTLEATLATTLILLVLIMAWVKWISRWNVLGAESVYQKVATLIRESDTQASKHHQTVAFDY